MQRFLASSALCLTFALPIHAQNTPITSPLLDPYGAAPNKFTAIDSIHWGAPYRCSSETTGGHADDVCDADADCPGGACVAAGTSGTTALGTTHWMTSYQDNAALGFERVDAARNQCYNTNETATAAVDPDQFAFCDSIEADYNDDVGTGGISQIEYYKRVWKPGFTPASGLRVLSDTIYLGGPYVGHLFGSLSGDYNDNGFWDTGEYAFMCGGAVNGCTFGSSQSPGAYVFVDPRGGRSQFGVQILAGGQQSSSLVIERPASFSALANIYFYSNGGTGGRLWLDDDSGDILRLKNSAGFPSSDTDGKAIVMGSQSANWGPLLGGVADGVGGCGAGADETPSCGSELCLNAGMDCIASDAMAGSGAETTCASLYASGVNFWAMCR